MIVDSTHAAERLRRIAQAIHDINAQPSGPLILHVAESALPAFGKAGEVRYADNGWQRVEVTVDGVRFHVDGPHYKLVYQGRAA